MQYFSTCVRWHKIVKNIQVFYTATFLDITLKKLILEKQRNLFKKNQIDKFQENEYKRNKC